METSYKTTSYENPGDHNVYSHIHENPQKYNASIG
jgi:hypothetical protein